MFRLSEFLGILFAVCCVGVMGWFCQPTARGAEYRIFTMSVPCCHPNHLRQILQTPTMNLTPQESKIYESYWSAYGKALRRKYSDKLNLDPDDKSHSVVKCPIHNCPCLSRADLDKGTGLAPTEFFDWVCPGDPQRGIHRHAVFLKKDED